MAKFNVRGGLRSLLTRSESYVIALEFVLSAVAVLLVCTNELYGSNFMIPWLNTSWSDLQMLVRGLTWSVFVFIFALYVLSTNTPGKYIRGHWLQLVVCLTWIPFAGDGTLLRHIHSLASLEMLTLVGSIAHAWMVARWTIKRFIAHPFIVITATAAVMIASASALLTHVEPKTFPNIWEAAWFCVVTIFTVGYGDIAPATAGGRAIAIVLILGGVSLAGVFIGYVSKLVQARLMTDDESDVVVRAKVARELERNNDLLEELVQAQRENTELNRQILEELRKTKNVPGEDGSTV